MKHKNLRKVGKTTNNTDIEMLPMFPLDKPSRLQVKETVFNTYDYKLFGEITEVDDYFDLIDALNYASPDDEFIIRIHSGGGLLGTADVIINAIQNTQARVHGHIESLCGSASTIIFLNCHTYSISPRAEFFVHTASSGTIGKEHENYASIMFDRKRVHKMVREAYEGLLTEEEIDNVLKGQDYYFDADELGERLETYTEFQQKKFEAEMEAFQKEQEDAIEGSVKTKKKKILPS